MKTVGMPLRLESSGQRRLLSTIGKIFNVRFEQRSLEDEAEIDAWFLHEADEKDMLRLAESELPGYSIIRNEHLSPCGDSRAVEFSMHPELSPLLRGRQICTDEASGLKSLPKWMLKFSVIASKKGAPIWVMQESQKRHHHYVSIPIPELSDDEALFQYFHGKQILRLLPLLLFLRYLTDDKNWEPPPLHACFMFDDPNLHWSTYGFINFAELVKHAKLHNYHCSFATIPLDSWIVHRPTANLFKKHSDRISLLIHGNDHTNRELANKRSDEERSMILRQTLHRVNKLEHRSGVEVSRVMAPPHGACTEFFLRDMACLGFEAACISRGSLRRHNQKANWLRTLGMRPSDMIGDMTVFPRFPFSGNCQHNILIAALLKQPIIIMGHHQDTAEGLDFLIELSGFINSIGNVKWTNLKQIARSHYERKLEGKAIRVKMFSKRIEICVPDGINQILVDRPSVGEETPKPLMWLKFGSETNWKPQKFDEPIAVIPSETIEIASVPVGSNLFYNVDSRPFHLWPFIRRQLTEGRDRIAPVIRRLKRYSES